LVSRGRIRFVITAAAAAALAAVAVAQNIPSVGDATSPPPQQPGHALITATGEPTNININHLPGGGA